MSWEGVEIFDQTIWPLEMYMCLSAFVTVCWVGMGAKLQTSIWDDVARFVCKSLSIVTQGFVHLSNLDSDKMHKDTKNTHVCSASGFWYVLVRSQVLQNLVTSPNMFAPQKALFL